MFLGNFHKLSLPQFPHLKWDDPCIYLIVLSEEQVSRSVSSAQNGTWYSKYTTRVGSVACLCPHVHVCSGEFGVPCTHALCVLYVHSFAFAGYTCDLPRMCAPHMGTWESTEAAVWAPWSCVCACVGVHVSGADVRAGHTQGPLHTGVFQSSV